MIWWYVALGSAVGGVARFALATIVQQRVGPDFPAGTLVVNVSGSLLLGFLLRYSLGTVAISPEVRALLTTGFCGGYTTFSTFSYDTMLLREAEEDRAAGGSLFPAVVSRVAVRCPGSAAAAGRLARRPKS